MAVPEYRALVVDDEAMLRMLTIRELSRNGFACDAARNGQQAIELAAERHYDVVVTDLSMPEMNGHALAVELLTYENRPAIIILTGVTEPRLAKDLIARGVDDIMFKPVDQSILAAKVRALVDRRAQPALPESPPASIPETGGTDTVADSIAGKSLESLLVDPADLEAKLAYFAKIAPISQTALDVINMTGSDTIKAYQLAAAIELDASLAAELLRIANCSFYNRTPHKVADLQEAVMRIGHKRTGELALMMSAMGAMTDGIVPWMNIPVIWKQSLAAGLAAESLIARAGLSRTESGLFLCAIMHSLGRVVLGSLYPDRYQAMLQFSQENHETLCGCEQRVFGHSHTEILARLLELWGIPAAIYEPLKHIHKHAASVAELAEPMCTRVELVQLAVRIGKIAVRKWEAWDRVDLPSADSIQNLGLESLGDLVQQLEVDGPQTIGQQSNPAATDPPRAASPELLGSELTYCKLSDQPSDFVIEILRTMGVSLHVCGPEDLSPLRPAIVNCLGVPVERLSEFLCPGSNHLLVTDIVAPKCQSQFGTMIVLPQRYGSFRSQCLKAVYSKQAREITR